MWIMRWHLLLTLKSPQWNWKCCARKYDSIYLEISVPCSFWIQVFHKPVRFCSLGGIPCDKCNHVSTQILEFDLCCHSSHILHSVSAETTVTQRHQWTSFLKTAKGSQVILQLLAMTPALLLAHEQADNLAWVEEPNVPQFSSWSHTVKMCFFWHRGISHHVTSVFFFGPALEISNKDVQYLFPSGNASVRDARNDWPPHPCDPSRKIIIKQMS